MRNLQSPPRAWIAPLALALMQFALMAIFLWLGKVGPAILVGLGGVVFLVLGVMALRSERRTYGHHHADGCAAERSVVGRDRRRS